MSKLDPRIMEVAVQSLAAGESLPDVAAARGVSALRYVYGMHAGNRMTGRSAGLIEEIRRTVPTSFCFLDNIPPEVVEEWLAECEARGDSSTWLIFRPYFNPSGGISGAVIEGYAQGVVIMLRERYLVLDGAQPRFPRIWRTYQSGRFILKLFNETNIGLEGFAKGRAGFADGLRCWKQARAVVRAAYANAKFMSIANTPGNDDLWFTGDTQNAAYWYHGKEAAKPNATPQEINAAIASCPFREMFELCDYIGIHVYANLTRTVSGDLATWYSRRFERAVTFLQPYIAQGKQLIISECDMGYDDGEEARARDFVWWLENVVAPNPAVLTVNHWWNCDKGEGDLTWDKHNTRRDGAMLPIVHAIAAHREGAGVPTPPPPPPPPEPAPIPSPTPQTEPQWIDFTPEVRARLTFHPAEVAAGGRYWAIKSVRHLDEATAGGTHHIYSMNPHDARFITRVSWADGEAPAPHEKPVGEPAANFAMHGEGYTVRLQSPDNLPSDSVSGLGMTGNRHISFEFTWEERVKAAQPPAPPTGGFMIDRRYMGRAGLGENYSRRPAGAGVDGMVLHHTGGAFSSSLDWLTNAISGVGTHYLIDRDGAIYQLVEDSDAAWHAGYSILNGREDCNRYTLGVELVNKGDGVDPYPQRQQDALVWLIKEKAREHAFGRQWVESHKVVRANFKAKYPNATNPDGSPIGTKTDPRGLDMATILDRAFGGVIVQPAPAPPPIKWDKAAWAIEHAARILQSEGYEREHDVVLSDMSYAEIVRERDK